MSKLSEQFKIYRGVHYPSSQYFDWPEWGYAFWRTYCCTREWHLFSEVLSSPISNDDNSNHYLVCDACQLMVRIRGFDTTYSEKYGITNPSLFGRGYDEELPPSE
jgi:hypothetical protein